MLKNVNIFNINSIQIFYHDHGAGRPLVMLHGFGASSYSWRHLTAGLSSRFRLISMDLKGFGLSDKPLDEHYTIEDQADIVTGFIQDSDLDDVVLVGHSFGGAVALLASLKEKEAGNRRITSLVLISAAGFNQQLPCFIRMLRTPILKYFPLVLLPKTLTAKMILKKAFYDDTKITTDMIEAYAGYMDLPGAYHALTMTAKKIIPENIGEITAAYPSIDVPALLIWGAKDEIVPAEVGRRLEGALRNAKLHIMQDCGHVPQEECPEQTIDLIARFLADPVAKRGGELCCKYDG